MNKINTRISNIHTELLDLIGDCLQFDLSGEQLSKIQEKKQDCIKALFALQDEIKKQINE